MTPGWMDIRCATRISVELDAIEIEGERRVLMELVDGDSGMYAQLGADSLHQLKQWVDAACEWIDSNKGK